mmetsp:Transcript_90289/g.160857  ORF Transcript_90289/g.160857 Transcript_90289/m.160857 type:complete len:268 (+) Transcript_90289:47-850(+)
MAKFGKPPDPSVVQPHFPGISARRFDPASATVLYRANIVKENNARSDSISAELARRDFSAKLRMADTFGDSLPGLANISAVYADRGWQKDLNSGRWQRAPGNQGPPAQQQRNNELPRLPQAEKSGGNEAFRQGGLTGGFANAVSSAPALRVEGQHTLHQFGTTGATSRKTTQASKLFESQRPASPEETSAEFHSSWRSPKRGSWRSSSERDLGSTNMRRTNRQSQAQIADLVKQRCGGEAKAAVEMRKAMAKTGGRSTDWAPKITFC